MDILLTESQDPARKDRRMEHKEKHVVDVDFKVS